MLRVIISLYIGGFIFLALHAAQGGQGSSCIRSSESPDDEKGNSLVPQGVEVNPASNPFYYPGLRGYMLSHMDAAGLRAFEKVNQACRLDAYKVDEFRWKRRWSRSGVHLISEISPGFSRLFKGKGQIFRIEDFILSGTSKRKMNWNDGIKFCGNLSIEMTAELENPTQCEVLDNDQWQTLIEVSKRKSGGYDSAFIPEMENTFWSKTPADATGAVYFTFNGKSLEFGSGINLPQMLYLLRSEDVRFFVRCACKEVNANR
jgi:hypothetical protein